MTTRRDFVKMLGVVPLFSFTQNLSDLAGTNWVASDGPTIRKINIFTSSGSFYRFIGMNSYDTHPKGVNGNRRSVTIEMSDGSTGIGTIGYSGIDDHVLSRIKALIGKDPLSFYQWSNDKIIGVVPEMKDYFFNPGFAWIESALLDGIGKQKGVPVWKLFGESVRNGIDPYDGTLYFEDIATGKDATVIGEIGKRIKDDGYRAIKLKLGRPSKWMKGEAGVDRDIEAFIALREAVGENFNIMADANNGYRDRFDWAVRMLKACAPYNMYFIEELFPDSTSQYFKLRDELLKENFFIPVAEGEDIQRLELFDPYLKDGIYNYIQPDMPTCGFSNILATARKVEDYPQAKLIPHVWQSQLGLLMSLHASKIQSNINYVEDSRYFEHAFITSKYSFKDGQWFIPDDPGWGIELTPDYNQFLSEGMITLS